MDSQTARQALKDLCPPKYKALADFVLDNPTFLVCSGSGSPMQHHYGPNQLIQHTAEVLISSLQMADFYAIPEEDYDDLYFAALYHDVGKCRDYEFDGDQVIKTYHYKKIYHISRSGIEWSKAAEEFGYPRIENVLHAILAHHQLREWGSPVSPQTKIAWILHCCDQMSARVSDSGVTKQQ